MQLGPVQEEFQGVVTVGMRVLVAALETKIAPHLKAMTKVNWAEMDELPDDTSPYMNEVTTRAREMMPQLGEALHPLYDGGHFHCGRSAGSGSGSSFSEVG